MRKWLAAGAVGFFLGGLAFVSFTPWGCEFFDFKWASVERRCVLPVCRALGNCGHWASPATRCDRLRPGDSLGRLWFQLGEPDRTDATHAWYSGGKAGRPFVVALEEEQVVSGCEFVDPER